jgi:hypothetical protein
MSLSKSKFGILTTVLHFSKHAVPLWVLSMFLEKQVSYSLCSFVWLGDTPVLLACPRLTSFLPSYPALWIMSFFVYIRCSQPISLQTLGTVNWQFWLQQGYNVSSNVNEPLTTGEHCPWTTGRNMDWVFNSRGDYLCLQTRPSLELKTRPKQLLGYLPLDIALPFCLKLKDQYNWPPETG